MSKHIFKPCVAVCAAISLISAAPAGALAARVVIRAVPAGVMPAAVGAGAVRPAFTHAARGRGLLGNLSRGGLEIERAVWPGG